jgi:hypothetical protein
MDALVGPATVQAPATSPDAEALRDGEVLLSVLLGLVTLGGVAAALYLRREQNLDRENANYNLEQVYREFDMVRRHIGGY